jgi:hypothetical protein
LTYFQIGKKGEFITMLFSHDPAEKRKQLSKHQRLKEIDSLCQRCGHHLIFDHGVSLGREDEEERACDKCDCKGFRYW